MEGANSRQFMSVKYFRSLAVSKSFLRPSLQEDCGFLGGLNLPVRKVLGCSLLSTLTSFKFWLKTSVG